MVKQPRPYDKYLYHKKKCDDFFLSYSIFYFRSGVQQIERTKSDIDKTESYE